MEFKILQPMVSSAIYDINDLSEGDYIYQEKINGMRGTYNPSDGRFYTINGNLVSGVKHLERELTGTVRPLDGEFFHPNLTTAQISGQARKKNPEHSLEFHLFDIADASMTDEERQQELDKIKQTRHIKRVKTYRGNKQAVLTFFKKVLNRGGEGVIVRDPSKTYRFDENGTIKLKEVDIPDDFNRWDK